MNKEAGGGGLGRLVRGARLVCPSPHSRPQGLRTCGDIMISSDRIPTARVCLMSSHSLPAQRGPRAPRLERGSRRRRQCKFPCRRAWAPAAGRTCQRKRRCEPCSPSKFPGWVGRRASLPGGFHFFPSVVIRDIDLAKHPSLVSLNPSAP